MSFNFVSVKIDRYTGRMSNKNSYHHGDLKTALLDAGDSVLRDRGLQGFTLRECARRAGVSHAAPRHHFGDVTGLLTALAVRGFERLLATLRLQLFEAGDEPAARLVATSRAYDMFAGQWSEHFRIMFRSDLLNIDDPAYFQASQNTYAEMTNVVLRLRGCDEISADTLGGVIATPDMMRDIMAAWCFVHGFAHLNIEAQFGMIPDGIRDDAMQQVAERLAASLAAEVAD